MAQFKLISCLSAAAVLAAVGLVTSQARPPAHTIQLLLEEKQLNCKEPPTFRTGYQREEGGIRPIGAGFSFQGVSWLEADLCTPGTLVMTAEGESADGQDPILQIALNSEVLSTQTFGPRRSVNVQVPNRGKLTLGYFNDYYRSDARIATLEAIQYSDLSCGNLKINVPKETGGQWIPEAKTASLVFSVPMTITPCSDGQLSLKVVGRAGAGEFPLIEFRQNKKILAKITTGINRQAVLLNVLAMPITITLVNPYFKQIADRNLNLLRVQFIPEAARKL